MSLNRREMIAAMAMQGILAHPRMGDTLLGVDVAVAAVNLADALIAELDHAGREEAGRLKWGPKRDEDTRTPPSQRKELAGDPAAPGSIDVGSSASGSKDGTPLPSDSSLSPGPGKLSECGSCGGRGQRQVPPDWTWRVCDRCCGSGKAAA